jgi:hypothetical protein
VNVGAVSCQGPASIQATRRDEEPDCTAQGRSQALSEKPGFGSGTSTIAATVIRMNVKIADGGCISSSRDSHQRKAMMYNHLVTRVALLTAGIIKAFVFCDRLMRALTTAPRMPDTNHNGEQIWLLLRLHLQSCANIMPAVSPPSTGG